MSNNLHICLDCGKTNEMSSEFRGRFICKFCGGRLHDRNKSWHTSNVDALRKRLAHTDIEGNVTRNPYSEENTPRKKRVNPWLDKNPEKHPADHLNPRSNKAIGMKSARGYAPRRKSSIWEKSQKRSRFDNSPAGRAAKEKLFMILALAGYLMIRVYLYVW